MSVAFPQRKICHTTPSPCPVSLPTLSLPTLLYKSLLTCVSSCFIVWSIDFSQDRLCDDRFRTGHESQMGSPFSTPLKKMTLLFTQGIYTTLLRLTDPHRNMAKRTSEQKRNCLQGTPFTNNLTAAVVACTGHEQD